MLDLGAGMLYADGKPAPLGSRAFEVLTALVEAGGEVVSKERLLSTAWPGLVVEEANLHVQVSALRKVLGSDAIATVQSLGYRFAWPAMHAESTGARHNLPAERTAFFGRTQLLSTAQTALSQSRLLSLIGIGGAGKTRLALALGRRAAEGFADGVWWVDLTTLDRRDQVPAAVARAAGIALSNEGDPARELERAIRSRQMLVILDNCEHLVDEVAQLADAWLDAVPGLKVIATSREALAVSGERVLAVGPLGVPTADASHEEIVATESVQLLIDRALSVAPWTGSAVPDLHALAQICRRVDGIPLAIEIAAAQLRTVSPSQLLVLLQERFRLLANLSHSLPRQRTMQTVIEWSFDHLQPREQELLLGLALCTGGCDFDAARAMMGPEMPEEKLTAALARLAEQALMTVQFGAEEPRYVLLETVSQFALDRLGTQPMAATLRARHVGHFIALAEAHDEEIMRRGQGAATLDRMEREHGNLLRAFQYCGQGRDDASVTDGLRLAAALRHYWVARSQVRLGLEVTQHALQRVGASRPPDRSLLLTLVSEAQLLAALSRLDEAVEVMARTISVARAIDDQVQLASSHGYRGGLLDLLGRFEAAASDHAAARRIAAEAGDERLLADALSRQANHAIGRGDLEQGAALLAETVPLRRKLGHGYRLAVALLNSGAVAVRRARWEEALEFLREAASLLAVVGSDALDSALVHNAATLLHRQRLWRELVAVRASEERHREKVGGLRDDEDQALVARQLGDARAALGTEAFDVAFDEGQRVDLAVTRKRLAKWLQEQAART
jgi:predicted ATPase